MARHALMLRGINLGASRRVPMAQLRALLSRSGYPEVATHLQSGNVVLTSEREPAAVADEVGALISQRFGFDVPVIARSHAELAAVVALNPLRDVAVDPKRHQVSFLADALPDERRHALEAAAVAPERVAVHGREVYAWHPDGVARSTLWNALAGRDLGVAATARNWTTVLKLAEMTAG